MVVRRAQPAQPRHTAQTVVVRPTSVIGLLATLTLLAGCASEGPTLIPPTDPVSSQSPAITEQPAQARRTPAVAGVITTGLRAPWGLAFLPDGSALVAERDTARILRVPAAGGASTVVGTVAGVQPGGEGGLLGIAIAAGSTTTQVFAYYTSANDNRVVALPWDGTKLNGSEAAQRLLLSGIPKGPIHDGGRLRFGPEGFLYVSTGDTGNRDLAQDRTSLAGKILRITVNGSPAPGNPDLPSPVWSLGHRNVQGLAFDSTGRLWASEFGQDKRDEFNLVRGAGNYGWPLFEGPGQDPSYVDPQVTWPTDQASPSGVAIIGDTAYIAALRGKRLWQVPVAGGRAATPVAFFTEKFGRIRTVEPAPDGSLWLVTSNTDGRGNPTATDDQILKVQLR